MVIIAMSIKRITGAGLIAGEQLQPPRPVFVVILPALQFSGGYEAQAVGYNAQQCRAPLYPLVRHHAAGNLIGQVLADLVCNITHISIKSEKIPANHFAHFIA